MATKRRLPVISSSGDPSTEGEPVRPAWQWVLFGAGATFVAWLPLTACALALSARVSAGIGVSDAARVARAGAIVAALYTIAIALGALAGGWIVGRWSDGGARRATLGGATASLAAVLLASTSSGFSSRTLLVGLITMPVAAAGGAIGTRMRTR